MKRNAKKIWMSVFTLVVIGMTLPVQANAGTINDTVYSTAVIEDERKYPDSIDEIPIPARFSKTPTGDKDKIVVTNDDVRYADEEGVERDPYSTHLFNVIVSEATEGPDGQRVTVHVEGRRGIEAVYWVKVMRIGVGEGEEVTEPPEYLWAEALDRLAGRLVLTDNIEPENDTFTDSPEIGETFFCKTDENKKGDITFELVFKDNLPPVAPEATELNYSVTPLSPSCDPENPNAAPIVAGTWPEDEPEDPWKKRLSDIDPGRYILKVSGGYDDEDAGFKRQIPFVVVVVKLNIWNGGGQFNFDGGASGNLPANPVPEDDKVEIGAYLLVNWDNDDGIGVLDADERPPWEEKPVPDLERDSVIDENNLARLQPAMESFPEHGTMALEVSGVDAEKIKLWKYSNKGTEISLVSNKIIWNLGNTAERNDFQTFASEGYWIEGIAAGEVERGITFTLRYKVEEDVIAYDKCKATVVMINLGNAVYRHNEMAGFEGIQARGHAGILARFIGECTRDSLTDAGNYQVIEIGKRGFGDYGPRVASLTSFLEHENYWGAFSTSNLSPTNRLMILGVVEWMLLHGDSIGYTLSNDLRLVTPNDWNRRISGLLDGGLRCDGVIEICYEINGINVWGHLGAYPQANFDITHTQTSFAEHNDTGLSGSGHWNTNLWPATQCGENSQWQNIEWETRMKSQELLQPNTLIFQ